ncbi:MAG TPA: site-2 protease family protein [Polyangiaceae bacterium]|nr:site-2 protease family protein [Polyangiaceae bacterium]
MKWSYRIARVSGIDIRVHLTFALIVAYFAHHFSLEHGGRGALFGALLVCCLFVCVVLHELGHSLVAQAVGVTVREIVLLPVGGVARLTREPEHPWHELIIALAGPLVNVAIGAVLLVVALLSFGSGWFLEGGLAEGLTRPSWGGLIGNLLLGNLMLAVFNMIPALPMDGGRVLRAGLAMLMSRGRATSIAATLAQVLSAGLIAYGMFRDPWLMLIGVFVFLGAAQERAASEASALLVDLRAADVVNPSQVVLGPGDTLGGVVGLLLRTPQTHFPVVHGDHLLGVLSREHALRALSKLGTDAYVAGSMQRDIAAVEATTTLDEVRRTILEKDGRPVVVRGPQGYLGLLSFEDVARVVRVAGRLEKSRLLRPTEPARGSSPVI